MNKALGIIGFIISIICLIACVVNVFISIDTYGKNKEKITILEDRVTLLEEELSAALGYDITQPSDNVDVYGSNTGNTSGAYSTQMFKSVKASDLATLSNGKKIVVWIGRQGCGYCSMYAPRIEAVGNSYNTTIFYLDLASIYDFTTNPVSIKDQAAADIMTNFQTDAENSYVLEQFGATPMTLFIENNKIVGNVIGAVSTTEVEEAFEAEGFKK